MDDYVFVNKADSPVKEILLLTDPSKLPTNVPAGSSTYKADLSYMAIFDGAEWQQIGGGDSGT